MPELFTRYDTALNIIRDACALVSMEQPTEAVSSTELYVVQMLTQLKSKGRELAETYEWQQFQRRGDATIGPAAMDGVQLPEDWAGFMPETGWDSTGQTRLIGPVNGKDWQTLRVREEFGSMTSLRFRLMGGMMYFEENPTVDTTVSFEYYSRGWVQDAVEDPPIFKDYIEADNDIVLFDSLLMVYALRLMWLETKGLNSMPAGKDYNARLNTCRSRDNDARILTLNPRRADGRLLDSSNVPDRIGS